MSINKLTPAQDMATRNFYTKVLDDETLFPEDPVNRIHAIGICRRLLNYVVVDGKHVDPDKVPPKKLHQTVEIEDEWMADALRAQAALYDVEVTDEKNKAPNTRKANSSKSAKSAKVRKAVLPEDV